MPIEDDPDLPIGQLSGASDRAAHDRLPSRVTQAMLPAPEAHHAAAQAVAGRASRLQAKAAYGLSAGLDGENGVIRSNGAGRSAALPG